MERCRALFELAVNQPLLDTPEVLWKTFIGTLGILVINQTISVILFVCFFCFICCPTFCIAVAVDSPWCVVLL